MFGCQRIENDDIVHAIQKLRPELLAERVHKALSRLIGALVLAMHREPDGVLLHHTGPDVGRHDDHHVFEAHRAALAVSQAAVVENLQHHVEDFRVGLLDLIEKNHRIRAPAHLFGKLASFFVANVSRRRPDHARHSVLLHVFGHVYADHGLFVVKEVLG